MRRLTALLLAAALLFLSGCSVLFERDYYAEEAFEAVSESAESEEDAADSISGYAALRRAIARMVEEHVESAELQFQNYDGNISQDISTACWEVKSSTALGAFAVDYISYDLSRIVSYYQAQIYITYKRSAYQVEALEEMENMAALARRLETALAGGETYLVLGLNAAAVTEGTVEEDISGAYFADPLLCPVLPAAETGVYPETGVSHIVEITLDYGMDGESLAQRRSELDEAVAALREAILTPAETEETPEEEETPDEAETPEGTEDATDEPETSSEAELVSRLCAALTDACEYDEDAGDTAWDALAQGRASSEGLAMALAAACEALDIECRVVIGRLDNVSHAWNIVSVDGAYYHVDVSDPAAFLAGDEELWGMYWWDTSEYPACPTPYLTSLEPAASEEPAEDGGAEPAGEAAEA